MSNITERLKQLLKWKKSKAFMAEKLGITEEKVEELMDELREEDEEENVVNFTGTTPKLVSEKSNEDGSKNIQYVSHKPLSRQEIEQLYGIDNISSTLSTYWNKQTASGKYLVSALIKCAVLDFYGEEEFEKKLREIFPNVKPVQQKRVSNVGSKSLLIYIADDHCGNTIKNSIYEKEYSGDIYQHRLLKINEAVEKLDQKFEQVFVVNMGDEVDGWNGKTTRYDHDLDGSLSNKEQFDIYTSGRRDFYDRLFTSGISNEYTVVSLNNSNHSGKGLSYIINKALEFYLEGRFPNVTVENFERFIDTIQIGRHVIGLTHGKDEKLMKSPLPLNLDAKTDLWLFQYYDRMMFSPSEYFISTVKADIHKYNVNTGKSGRYVNVPSIAGGSSWIELNFGDTRAGALLEIIEPESPNIVSIPIWFN